MSTETSCSKEKLASNMRVPDGTASQCPIKENFADQAVDIISGSKSVRVLIRPLYPRAEPVNLKLILDLGP